MKRRSFMTGLAIASVPVSVAAAAPKFGETPSIDDFLSKASPSERAWYHANALAEVMGEISPERSWRSSVNIEHHFALICGDEREA